MTHNRDSVLAVIPARYGSTRFPGKPLVLLAGKPMIQHVYERVIQVPSIERVVVATDDSRIFETVLNFGGTAIMTRDDHETGTDRLVEVASSESCEWVLNVQGDEPLISPEDLNKLVSETRKIVLEKPSLQISTLVYPISEPNSVADPNVVKVVLNRYHEALYFSRSAIPFVRQSHTPLWKHIGVYMYRRDFLLKFSQWTRTALELTEQLEQLRVLENGYSIFCTIAQNEGVGVDRPEDLPKAEQLLNQSHPQH